MSDLRSLIGYLKGEIAEETEHLQKKNEICEDGRKGWKGKDYYITNGIIEGMQRTLEMVESWCTQKGIDYDDILEGIQEDYEEEEEDDYS